MALFDYVPGEPSEWVKGALCAEPGAPDFFVNELNRPAVRDAKSWCQLCPVRNECLAEAIDRNERFGIWGGLDERERAALRRRTSRTYKSA